ncbi:SagB family peptide dehydrogenase [Gordonia caeni]|uniref:SagB family peptide dehydrogenase n=1 Tax=Gordonia caeni TaxID=1007097 RepID=A0ABP7PNX6_9ACTN
MTPAVQTRTAPVAVYRWQPPASAVLGAPGTATLLPSGERLTGLSGAQGAALRALGTGPIRFDQPPPEPVAALLDRLLTAGLVTVSVGDAGRETAEYTLRPFRSAPSPRAAAESGVLSKFTVLHRVGDELIAENPRAWCDVALTGPRAIGLVTGLTGPESDAPGDDDGFAAQLWSDLRWAGHAVAPGDDEDADLATAAWRPHELWFHRRSTVGDRGSSWTAFGPTRWADGRFEPLPARPEPYPGEPVPLPVPDLEALRTGDRPLTEVVEDRVSTRTFDEAHPMTAAQLGELLFRCARTRSTRVTDAARPVPEELPSRPYPSGGSLYELEVYPVIRHVDGIAAGMYHYDTVDHVLRPVAAYDDAAVTRLIAPAALTLADGRVPQVLLVLAARTGRLMWTYEEMPYAVILKHVGVLTQTLYLTATAMGLGGVAQGYGDTAAFAAATGRDELAECNVGSFVVGSLPASP